ncbi:MAG: purK [Firmicutes bacterium]|nr:purK [Bacillota bacterium]
MYTMNKIRTVLVANRGEIATRVFRACFELGIRTVAIYSNEDILSLHRYKADEAYLVGEGKSPTGAYLDIESILKVAKEHEVDAIHPGYGFLSENMELAKRCAEEGIIFIGPRLEHLQMFGDKINARMQAEAAGIPMIPGSNGPVKSLAEIQEFAEKYGFPIIIKASLGGGGRGMRIVRNAESLEDSYNRARSEAKTAFGCDEVYVEKLLENIKHIEVQILGDEHGNVVHLFERDCSVQRRHQKVVEVAPSIDLPDSLRFEICDAAVKLMKNVKYINAGTVEFLVTPDQKFYFIEVNPRIQVEHTITEMITGIDIVQAQLLIADGYSLYSEEIGMPAQEDLYCHGHAIQCRVTTEDPANHFMPDTGKITVYRSGGGFGVRLDAGNAYAGSVITPYYDSLLVKVSTMGLTHKSAITKMKRCLAEFRIRGLKTNIPFLYNVVNHEKFLNGTYNTMFIDSSPELFVFRQRKDRGTKLLNYLGDISVNGFEGLEKKAKPQYKTPRVPIVSGNLVSGTKQILDESGPNGLVKWIKEQDKVLLTDTTMRDAHQSILATRIRTIDMLKIASPTAKLLPDMFSLELWGGATFDVAYRFLKEDPWERLALLRKEIPNILFQMLLRGANAVGYTNYPDNVIREFVAKSAQAGIDVYRIFDSLNWLEGMRVAIEAVRENNKVAEASICYTGDILDASRTKYDLNYYINLAKELEGAGAHILAIKDMAGLLKPEAAYRLISSLKEAVDIPVHLHSHDTSGNGIYTCVRAIEAGVDILDVAVSSLAGGTSAPSANSLYYALAGTNHQPNVDIKALTQLSRYWEDVRELYGNFETGVSFPNPEVYLHEMPGGQHSNLHQQAKAVGLEFKWDEIKAMYRRVNDLFGDIIKVTPSSKVVGDMALYMVQNNLNEDDIYDQGEYLDFPNSVVEFFEGQIGQPYKGFPKELQRIILKGRDPLTQRPGELLEPANFEEIQRILKDKLLRPVTAKDAVSYALYPKVFLDWVEFIKTYGDVSVLNTPTFFYGMEVGEEIKVDIEQGKKLVIKLVSIGAPNPDGTRSVAFELNGLTRDVTILDKSVKTTIVLRAKADKDNPGQIGATMSGTVVKVLVEKGAKVKKGDHLLVTEAMKMETTVQAPFDGYVKDVNVKAKDSIATGDFLIEIGQ